MKLNQLTSRCSSHLIWLLMSVLYWLFSVSVQAEEKPAFSLQLSPEKCVALRQGQTCYVDIALNWTAPESSAYCLFASTQNKPLKCWDESDSGSLEMEFSSNENTWFYLKQNSETLAQVELKMAWVYKSKRSSVTWRVF